MRSSCFGGKGTNKTAKSRGIPRLFSWRGDLRRMAGEKKSKKFVSKKFVSKMLRIVCRGGTIQIEVVQTCVEEKGPVLKLHLNEVVIFHKILPSLRAIAWSRGSVPFSVSEVC